MKEFQKWFIVLVFISNVSLGQIQPVRVEPVKNTKYLEHLPADYNSTTKTYPLIIWLHGTGERGTNINKVRYFGISKHIENGHNMTFKAGGTGADYSFIVMSPQLKSGGWNGAIVKGLINHAINSYRVDPSRIYIVGLSLGGNGVWGFSYNSTHNNPNRVAAFVPIAAWGNKNIVCNLGTPTYAVWGFHGENDGTITINRGQVMIDAYNACLPAPAQPALFTRYPGVGHNSWDRAFRTDNSLHTPNMYEWLLLQTLGGNPTANAGNDQTITLPTNTTSFTGSGTDSDGTITGYLWSKVSGPTVTFVNETTATLTTNDLLEGTYTFELQVTDNDGNTSVDQVNLTVEPIAVNQIPVANAGLDQIVTLPTNSLNLAGSGTDSDGSITTYAWTKQSGPAATMVNTNQATLTLSNLLEGTYVFRLTVTDNSSATAFDEVTVTVNPVAVNQNPSVNTGVDQTVNLPTNTINLIGVASDPDGAIATYLWSKQSGPASGTLVNSNQAILTVNGLIAGVYIFRLAVTDNDGGTAMDEVQVTVVAANISPTVNAGPDLALTLPTNLIIIIGSGTDTDGTIATYLWTKISGPAATLTNSNQSTLTVSGLVAAVYTFRLTITDNDGASSFDEMTLTVSTAPVNQLPIANAGPDSNFALPQDNIILNGSGSDSDGTIASYLWSKVSGPTGTLSGTTTSDLAVSNMIEGTYVFDLTVMDNDGGQSADQVIIIVSPAAVNQSPVVNTGVDQFLNLPTNILSITATATDDGTITSYLWTKQAGPAATMSGTGTVTLDLSGLVLGVYTFRLTVTDDGGATSFDEVNVDVSNLNLPPTVDVGADLVVQVSDTPFSVFASSNDPDGTIATSTWTQESGPSATFSVSPNQLDIFQVTVGIYIFRLTVIDDLGASSFDEMKITVSATASNQLPIVNAGLDQTIIFPSASTNISGSATDSDGTIASYQWTKTNGPAGDILQNQTTSTLTVTNLVVGVYTYRLSATDNDGGTSFDEVSISVVNNNQAPVADAGATQSITLPVNSLVLLGSGTDSDGTIAGYLWTKVTGPTATLTNVTTANLSLSNLLEGNYTFRLIVTDNDGASGFSDVTVVVQPAAVNQSPTALAGTDQSIQLPTNSITLFGAGSDNDGTIATYLWTKISGPTASLTNPTSPNLSINNMLEGTYILQLVVTDDNGATGSDNVTVLVLQASANLPPVANAGSDLSITLPTNSANINGSGSDNDGTVQSYLWEVLSGPTSTLTNQNTSTLTISDCLEGSYALRLTVTDDSGDTGVDQMTLTVLAANVNQAPTVDAGIDLTIKLPKDSTELAGAANDTDGSIASVLWTKTNGPTATLSNGTTQTLRVTNMLEGQYTFSFTATDDLGAIGSNDVIVTVINQAANLPPIADAGLDQTIFLPINTLTLNGSGQDTDGSIASYLWEKISGPSFNFVDASLKDVDIIDLVEGQYTFQLSVIDDMGGLGTDQVLVNVLPATVNQPPIANAGGDKSESISSGSFTVNGTGSDPEGGALIFLWEVISSPGGTFGDPNQQNFVVSDILLGVYSFKLTVTDDQGASTFDLNNITVVSADLLAPLADAGIDQTIELADNTALLVGKGMDTDGIVVGFQWSQVEGIPATLTFENTDSLVISNFSLGEMIFELVVIDNDGLSGIDRVIVSALGSGSESSINAPKLFSPNGDGINDNWIFTDNLQEIADCSITIFDRFGKKVFEAQPYQNNWDARFNGQDLPEDAYYYVLECSNGSTRSGGVRIVR